MLIKKYKYIYYNLCIMYNNTKKTMNPYYIISFETLKLFGQGALGAMSFGMYHQYTTNKIMELNNEKEKYFRDEITKIHNEEMKILKEKINKLEKKHWFYW